MFLTRLISGIVLVAVALLTIITGGLLLYFVVLALSLLGMFELYRAMGVNDQRSALLSYTGYAGAVLYYILLLAGKPDMQMAGLVFAMMALMGVYVFTYPRFRAEQVMAAFGGIVYVAVMLSFIYQTRILPDGKYTVWLIFICAWGCDTFAYCSGKLFGKHKMTPVLSPKKSVEGAIGGVIGAALIGLIYAVVISKNLEAGSLPVFEYTLICALGALVSMVGDLAASAIKRNFRIKDYGRLIPGHGGILDRFDSIIFTAPVIWLLAVWIL